MFKAISSLCEDKPAHDVLTYYNVAFYFKSHPIVISKIGVWSLETSAKPSMADCPLCCHSSLWKIQCKNELKSDSEGADIKQMNSQSSSFDFHSYFTVSVTYSEQAEYGKRNLTPRPLVHPFPKIHFGLKNPKTNVPTDIAKNESDSIKPFQAPCQE